MICVLYRKSVQACLLQLRFVLSLNSLRVTIRPRAVVIFEAVPVGLRITSGELVVLAAALNLES